MRKIEFSPPDITEREIAEVCDTLRSGWITTGPKTKLLENRIAEYCHLDKAVCLNSATACMENTLHLLGIGPGDEVITSAYTYSASASVICHVGATVVLVDTAVDSYEMDYEQVAEKINERTKAIISVDLAGVLCDYDKIFALVKTKQSFFKPKNKMQEKLGRIAVVADSAHAIGARRGDKICGELADFTSFSFHAVKNLTTAEGGAVVWKDIQGIDNEYIYKQYMLLSLHGQSKDALAKTRLGAWEYDIVAPYYKCNMTDIMASLGLVQLDRYPEILEKRRALIYRYEEKLKRLPITMLKHYGENYSSSGHLLIIRINGKTREECNRIIEEMASKGIATNVHYKPLPLLSAYKNMGFDILNFPNSYKLYENAVTLPLHNNLTFEDVDYVVESLEKAIK
ncbi:dTDP-4-amino-4,6-dideoxygalactose transaminase [Lachnospiraceae bacterium PF1-22]|uniref:DegT/DnrJ/EryC1/StrS family aminotransferase n=1 Tax=Ohessyouella blattaphilus TaxID=2949333 RepID=UPI003E24179F